jgi:diphthamide synthase (EF-2-diphthine--ammonia ligase)
VENRVGAAFAGREYDESLLRDLPAGIDPCGENGEFHSFVFDGPIFRRPIRVLVGETVMRDGRYYADLTSGATVKARS